MAGIRRAGSATLPPLRQRETVGAFSREQTAVFIRIFMGAEGRLRGSSSAAYSMQSNSLTKRVSTWAIIQTLHHRNARKWYSNPYFFLSLLVLHPLPIHYPALLNIGISYIFMNHIYMFSRLDVLELPKVLTEFPWMCSAAFGWCTNKQTKKSLQWHTACQWLQPIQPVCVGFFFFFFYSRWFWIQVDFLNPCKYGHIKACKCAHTPTHARTHNRSPPTCLPLTGKCHCGVQLMRWIQCTLLTVISCLLREETVMTGMKVQVCEHGGKRERGGSPSLTVSRGELENRRVEEEHVKRQRGGKKKVWSRFQNRSY